MISDEESIVGLKNLGKGPLTLGIFCTRCNAQYELNNQAVAMAILTETTFLEYLKYDQSDKCTSCTEMDRSDEERK